MNRKAREAATLVYTSFTWRNTKQGVKYWDAVYNNLIEIAEGEKQEAENDLALPEQTEYSMRFQDEE